MVAAERCIFELDGDLSDGSLVGLTVTTPDGLAVRVWAEVELDGRVVVLRQFLIDGVNVAVGQFGTSRLRRIADDAMEFFDVDAIRIEEARRTTGANPDRIVPTVPFRRRGRQPRP